MSAHVAVQEACAALVTARLAGFHDVEARAIESIVNGDRMATALVIAGLAGTVASAIEALALDLDRDPLELWADIVIVNVARSL